MIDPQAELTPEQQQMLQEMLDQLLEELAQDLQRLLDWLMSGQGPTQEELEEMADQAGLDNMNAMSPYAAQGRPPDAAASELGKARTARSALGDAGRAGHGPGNHRGLNSRSQKTRGVYSSS